MVSIFDAISDPTDLRSIHEKGERNQWAFLISKTTA
jgi:hypothetical protein